MPALRKGIPYKLRIVPSGYEFLGPGNDISYFIPRNHNDAVARDHDIQYAALQKSGINPYITFSRADAAFLSDIHPNDFPTYFAKYVFKTKQYLAYTGLLPSGTSLLILPWGKLSGVLRVRLRSMTGEVLPSSP